MRQTFLSRFHPSNVVLKVGFVLAIISALMIVTALTVFGAGSPPTITVSGVNPGSEVTLTFSNLPVNDTFAVSMSPGSGVGVGPVVAHFNTGAGGQETYTFEILTDVASEQKISVRIDDGLGVTAFVSFDNTAFLATPVGTPVIVATSASETAVVPVTGGAAATTAPTTAATVAPTAAAATTAPTTAATVAPTAAATATVAPTTAATSASTPTVAATTQATPTPAATTSSGSTTATPAAGSTTSTPEASSTPAPSTATTPSTSSTAVVPVTGATPVATATVSPTTGLIHVLHVEQGGWVQVQIDNLPLNTLFSVTIGPAGSQGFGGYKVADLPTEDQSTHTSIFEIPVLLNAATSLDLRLEAPGFLYLITFDNTNK